ncbi:MAG: chloride channel protein [Mucilaginibacter sp.]
MKIPIVNGIPVSPLLSDLTTKTTGSKNSLLLKKRLLFISALSVVVAMAISVVAKALIYLINLVTNIFFYGSFNFNFHSPAYNQLGAWVIIIPAIGGVLVGLMALYGSKAIRGHGIPEAMEQILVNQSKIKPSITFLKPLSSAIAIGTGGPFGAEGPIIATGGALGSTLGQVFKITNNERKILLAAGATAGMTAIFGTPIAGIFLAIELLLFEFSPKAILPVALACITGAAGHHLLFESGPVFPMPNVLIPTNGALAIYSGIGLVIGFLSLGLTKVVYYIEDGFEKLPIHWMWWPAIGGVFVGLVGYFYPHTLGVGYDNITHVLSGNITITLLINLMFFKFLSWAIALGSGTSGGTLAPLLTIGGAAGALMGSIISVIFPGSGISVPLAGLVGMSAMFAGASRAYLTSITFALEATMQSNAVLPLLGACSASYLVSFLLMENTIMTEKIARRGVFTPDSYRADPLEKLSVSQVITADGINLNGDTAIKDAEELLNKRKALFIKDTDTLALAASIMAKENVYKLPVISAKHNQVIGVLTYKDILASYNYSVEENELTNLQISLKRKGLKILIKGRGNNS